MLRRSFMLDPLGFTSPVRSHICNMAQDRGVVYDLYKQAQQEVGSLDAGNAAHKELLDWFEKKLSVQFREGHDIENNDDLKQDLEEFIDHIQSLGKGSD